MKPVQMIQTFIAVGTLMLCSASLANGAANGDEFRATATSYEQKAQQAMRNGRTDVAALYREQAAIKAHAATLADQGRWSDIDWSQYHANESSLAQMNGYADAKQKKHR